MFDICDPWESAGREQVEQSLRKKSGYVNEMALWRKAWMVSSFGEVRGPSLEKAPSMER